MGYVAGETILDDEYNVFVNSSSSPFGYNHFAGEGALQYGLGQTEIPTVVAGGTVLASHWNSLFTGIDTIANHTNDSMTTRGAVTAGDTIAIKAAVAADLATLAASVAGGSVNATALDTSSAKQTSSASGQWTTNHTVEHTVTFANANTMRYFFNGGGKIRLTGDRTGAGLAGDGGSESNTKDADWTALFAAVGDFDIGATVSTRSGSGETVTTNGLDKGFYDLSTGYTVLLKLTSDNSSYTSNYIEISAKTNAAPGTAVSITVKYDSRDGSADNTFTSGNTSNIDSQVDRVGVARVRTFIVSPNDEQGLASDITESSTAVTSNTTDG